LAMGRRRPDGAMRLRLRLGAISGLVSLLTNAAPLRDGHFRKIAGASKSMRFV